MVQMQLTMSLSNVNQNFQNPFSRAWWAGQGPAWPGVFFLFANVPTLFKYSKWKQNMIWKRFSLIDSLNFFFTSFWFDYLQGGCLITFSAKQRTAHTSELSTCINTRMIIQLSIRTTSQAIQISIEIWKLPHKFDSTHTDKIMQIM